MSSRQKVTALWFSSVVFILLKECVGTQGWRKLSSGGGGLTQQILPRLLLAPADGIDMPVPDVCHLSRNTSHSFPQSTLILLYTGLQKVYNLGYDRSHNARSDRMIQFITTRDRHQHPPPSPLTSSVQFLPFPGEAQLWWSRTDDSRISADNKKERGSKVLTTLIKGTPSVLLALIRLLVRSQTENSLVKILQS